MYHSTADTVLHNCVAHNCRTGFITGNLGSYYVSCIASTCVLNGFNINGQWNHRYISCASYLSPNNTSNGYADWDVLNFLTEPPFVNPDNFDFRLNDLPGGGALLKSRGGLGSIINMSQSTSFEDPGVVQASRKIFSPNMLGGIGG